MLSCIYMLPSKHLIIPLKTREKKTELNELSELEYLKHPHRLAAMLTDMLSYICMLTSKHLFIYPIKNQKKRLS